MEKFSNSRTEYWDRIKSELLEAPDSEKFRFRYLQIGQLLSHGFSIFQLEGNPLQLILKIWKAEFDNQRFKKGIYNLDRLAIIQGSIDLSLEEARRIEELLDAELKLSDCGGFVLDGLLCELDLENKKLVWNCNVEINDHLLNLVEFLRHKVGNHPFYLPDNP